MPFKLRGRLRESPVQPLATGATARLSGRQSRIGRPKLVAAIVMIVAFSTLAACSKNAPGRDGRYATHDRGNNNGPW